MSSTLSFLISPHVKVSEEDLWSLVGRDELHIEQAPSANEKQDGNFTNLVPFLSQLLVDAGVNVLGVLTLQS